MEYLKKHTKRILIFAVAIVFLVIGALGVVLPLIPGLVFFVLALLLIGLYSTTVKSWITLLKTRVPRIAATVEKVERFITQVVGEP